MPKTQNTRILGRFTGYSVADCDCRLCRWYGGKKRGCKLDECCCAEERKQAQELSVSVGKAAALCRG